MYRTSSAYKAEMQTHQRNYSYVWVFLGMVNREAQDSATIDAELTDYSQTDIFESSRFTGYYATCEENFATDSCYFMPTDTNYYRVFNQGAVTEDILGSITFRFSKTIDKFGGLTLEFEGVYPTEFEATNGHDTYTFEVTEAGRFIAEGIFYDSDYITITPISMVGGEQRLRIHSIMFGLGFNFGNRELISTKRTNTIDHLSLELPKKTFEFTIDNYNQKWTMDNPKSYARALDEMQIVQVTYGRELEDGSVFKIPSAYMALQSWSSTHSSATFKAVGFLDYSTTTYYQGKVGLTTLYDLAVDVLEDMGLTDYKVDPFLKKLTTNNPIPTDTHKSCLQMIANAGLCTMREDNNGVIKIKASIKMPRYTVTVENIEDYSNTERFQDKSEVFNFATCEKDYATDECYFFGTNETGVVSYMYPTDDGLRITIELEAIWTFTGMTFRFGIISPTVVTIAEYNDGRLVETNDYEVDDLVFFIDREFYEIDKLVITFTNPDETRIHLNKMLIGNASDYEIAERDMQSLPTSTQTQRVRSVNVKYYDFIESDKKVTSQVNADEGENLLTFDTPCYDYAIEGCTITDSGAYYVVFTSPTEETVKLEAKMYDKSENTFTKQLRETGQDVTLENDLISDADLAERVADWLAEYYMGEVDYTVVYRGEPALESGDRIFMENRFVDNNLILVTSEELTTGIGMSVTNTIKARQLSYDLR